MNDATIRKPRPSLSATSGDPSKYPLSHPLPPPSPPPPSHYRYRYDRHEGEGMMDAGPIRSGGGGEKVDYDSHQTRRRQQRRPRGHYRGMKEHDDRDYSPSYRSLKYSNDYDHGGDEDAKRSQSRTRGGIGGGERRRNSISRGRWNGKSQRSKRNTKSRSHRSRSSSFRSESSRSYSRSRGRRSRRRYSWSPLDKSRSRSNRSSRSSSRRMISRRSRRDRRDDEKRYIDGKGTRYALTRRRYRSRSRSRTRSRSNSSWRYRHDVKQRYGRRGYQREINGNEYAAGIDAESHVYGVVSDDENVQRRNRVRDGIVDDGRRRRRRRKWTRRRSRSRDSKREVKRRHDYEKRRRKRKRKEKDYSQSYGRSRSRSTRSHGSGGSMSSLDHDDSYGHFEGGAGTVIDGRYKIIKDVGLGTFGRVVQAIDLHHYPDGNIERLMDRKQKVNIEDTVAIKIVRDVKRYHESAMIEADILKDVNRRGGRGQSLCAVLLNHFDLKGHCCLVFECLGRSLYDFMKTHGFKPFPLYCVRDFARQLLKALEFIHSFGLIHTDLKPENILLKSNKERQYRLPDGSDQQVPASTSIKLIDFGGATYDHEKKSTIINTRQYRSPEVILGLGWSMPSDMWSAGCIVAELYKGDLLFATHDNFEHLALMERIVGRFPFDMVSRSKEFRTSAFDYNGWHKLELSPSSKSYVRKTKPLELVVKNDDRDSGLLELLQSLLTIEPCKRSTASEALMNTSLFNARLT